MTVRFTELTPMLQASDLQLTIAWYESVLGFRCVGRQDQWCRLERDAAALMFMRNDHGSAAAPGVAQRSESFFVVTGCVFSGPIVRRLRFLHSKIFVSTEYAATCGGASVCALWRVDCLSGRCFGEIEMAPELESQRLVQKDLS